MAFQTNSWNQNPRQRFINNESTKFPGITKEDEEKIMNTAKSQAHSEYEENLIANDLYKAALKNQSSKNYANNRQDAKQEMYNKSLNTQDKKESNKLRTTERTAEVADMIRNYAKNNGYGTDLEGWQDIDIINGFTNDNKEARQEIQDYINGEESSFSFSKRMGFGAGSERSRFDMLTEDKGEWNDDILGHFETESYEDADNKVGTRFKNLGKSAYNLASDITNMVANPLDTVNNLGKAAVGGVSNLLEVDDEVSQWGDRFESANQVADGMGDFLKNRYGGVDQIANSLYQDPVGVISDIASIVTGGAGAVKGVAGGVAKGALKAGAKNVATKADDISRIAGNIAKAGVKYDPATMILEGEGKLLKGTAKTVKNTAKAVAHPFDTIKGTYKSVAEGLDKMSERGAEKITNTATAQDKLYKAQEPRMNVLTRSKDLQKRRVNSDRANQLIVDNGYKPTDTASRVTAHEATMRKIWKEVENKINGGDTVYIDQSRLAEKLSDYITEQKNLGSSFNEADITALEKEIKTLDGKAVDLPTLEKKKQLYNSIINNWGEQKVSDVFANGIKQLTHEIGVIEDSILAEIPGEFQKLKSDFGALADTYEDVFKADMKNQRKKGLGLAETYSRIEGAGDMINGALSIFNGGAKDIIKGAGKVVMGKALQKAKDVDFLVKQGFDELVKGRDSIVKAEGTVTTPKNITPKDTAGSTIPKISKEFTREEMNNFKWKPTEEQSVEEVIAEFQKNAKDYEGKGGKFTLNNLLQNIPKYKTAKVQYDKFLNNMADAVEGIAITAPLKVMGLDGVLNGNGIKRALEKANKKGKVNGIDDVTDIVRGTVTVSDEAGINRVIDRAEKNGIDIDNKFKEPTNLGYKDLSFIHKTENGIPAEVQINIPEIIVAKEGKGAIEMKAISEADYEKLIKSVGEEGGKGHKYYEEYRDLETKIQNGTLKGEEAEKATARMAEIEKESNAYYKKFEDIVGKW